MKPLVSVIVPVYNVAKVLERSVNSILEQTYDNLEIILVDDGSTDMSGKFCDIFASRDQRIKVIHQENRGLSAARNAGIDVAKGNFITFVDSDDAISPDMITVLLNLCLKNNVPLSICSFQELRPGQAPRSEDSEKPFPSESPDSSTLSTADCLSAMLLEQGFHVSAWGKLYARDLFRGVRFPEHRLYEDVGTTYRAVLSAERIAVTPEPLYYYYQNPDSITTKPFSLAKLDLIDLTDTMCDSILTWSKFQNASVEQQLLDVTRLRRMHARFSILRQMVFAKLSPEEKQIEQDIISYLRHHSSDILRNPVAGKRDHFALRALQLGLPVFRFAWKYYDKHR